MNWYRKTLAAYNRRRKPYSGPPRYFGPPRLINFMGRAAIIGNTMNVRKNLPNFGFRWDGNIKIDGTQLGDAPDNVINGGMIGLRELTPEEVEQLGSMGIDISMSGTVFQPWRDIPQPVVQPQSAGTVGENAVVEESPVFEEDKGAQSYEANIEMLMKIRDASGYDDVKSVMREQTAKLIEILSNADLSSEMTELRDKFMQFMANAHSYSFNNMMLMFFQNTDIEMVGGEKNLWNKKGRKLREGQEPIWILAPQFWRPNLSKNEYNQLIRQHTQRGLNTDTARQMVENSIEKRLVGFKDVPVYDIKQTEPIPGWQDPKTGELPFDYENFHEGYRNKFNTEDEYTSNLWEAIKNAAINEKISVNIKDTGEAGGNSSGGNINISEQSFGERRIGTMFHEYAHEVLHSNEEGRKKRIEEKTPKHIVELEAESTSFLLMQAFGLTSDPERSAKYILLWKGTPEDVQKRQEQIHKAYQYIYRAVRDSLDRMIGNGPNIETKPSHQQSPVARFNNWYKITKISQQNTIKVWLDDVRPMPSDFDVHAKTSQEAINLLSQGNVSFISFDHDLGGDDTGYIVAKWIEKSSFEGTISYIGWGVHSANPVGANNIKAAMINAEKYWNSKEQQDELV